MRAAQLVQTDSDKIKTASEIEQDAVVALNAVLAIPPQDFFEVTIKVACAVTMIMEMADHILVFCPGCRLVAAGVFTESDDGQLDPYVGSAFSTAMGLSSPEFIISVAKMLDVYYYPEECPKCKAAKN